MNEEKSFISMEFQIMNVWEMRKVENHHLATRKNNNCFRQESSTDDKISEGGKKGEKQNFCILPQYLVFEDSLTKRS